VFWVKNITKVPGIFNKMNFIIKFDVSLNVRAHSTKWNVAQNSVLEFCQTTTQLRVKMFICIYNRVTIKCQNNYFWQTAECMWFLSSFRSVNIFYHPMWLFLNSRSLVVVGPIEQAYGSRSINVVTKHKLGLWLVVFHKILRAQFDHFY
jgi:hypothetical protein